MTTDATFTNALIAIIPLQVFVITAMAIMLEIE